MPGHLVGPENSPPAAYADQQHLSSHLHEWLEAALLQQSNLHTGSSHNDQMTSAAVAADPVSPSVSTTNSSNSAADGFDWEQVQEATIANSTSQPAQTPSSTSDTVIARTSTTHSLQHLELPFAGLFDAAFLQDSSSPSVTPGSSNSVMDLGLQSSETDYQEGVVIEQDAAEPLQQDAQSDSSDGGWNVLPSGSR